MSARVPALTPGGAAPVGGGVARSPRAQFAAAGEARSLRARFAAGALAEPLDDLSAGQREELAAVLENAATFEDLPGRWQAALLQAESGGHAGGGCCR